MRFLPHRVLFLLGLIGPMLFLALAACSPPAQEGPLGVELERVFPNVSLQRMVFLTHAGDGTGRVFVVQQPGVIHVFPNDQAASPATFLDIRQQVNDAGNEEGLLGLAFDPQYADNGHFYVYYSAAGPRRSVLSRFTVSDDTDRADPASELVLLEVPQPFGNHNGGMLAFGPDGYLYVSLGDGGSSGDPQGHGQNTETLLGAILRIDVRDATPEQPYTVPPDNPFVQGGGRQEIWAYGLRNPWRFSFDPDTGDMWVADVGQDRWESIYIVEPGRNYGWNIVEGEECYPPGSECDTTGLEMPLHTYRIHVDGDCSVTGGYVYHGRSAPALEGAYLFADYCSGRVWAMFPEGDGFREPVELVRANFRIPSFGIDEEGEVYLLGFDGGIYRFTSPEPQLEPATTVTPGEQPAATAMPTPVAAHTPTPRATPPGVSLNGPNGPASGLPGLLAFLAIVGFVGATLFLIVRSRL